MNRPQIPSPSRETAFVAAYVLVWLAGLGVAIPGGGVPADVVNLAYFLMGAIASVASWRAAGAGTDARSRRAWQLLAFSWTTIWAGGLVWTYWEPLIGAPMPEWLVYLTEQLYIPFSIAAFVAFPVDPEFRWRNARARVDGALFAVGAVVLSWHFIIEPVRGIGGTADLVGAVGEWAIALAASFALLRSRDRTTRAAVGLALSGHLVYVLTGFFFMRAETHYAPGHWVDSLWLGAWVFRWLAARRAVDAPSEAPSEAPRETIGYRGSLAPALFVAGAYGLLLLSLVLEGTGHAFYVGLAAALMTALLLLRQRLSLLENSALSGEAAKQTAVFRSIVASATDLVLLVRSDLRVAYASPSVRRLVGSTGGSLFSDLLHPDDRQGVLEWLEERSSSLGQRSYRCRLRDQEGRWREIELRAQDRRGVAAVEGFVLNGRDVTHENALERRLGHARKLAMLSAMAGRIAHAFNNALAAMQVHAEELSRDLPGDSPSIEDARAIGAAAERGAGITRQLLGFSGRHVIRPEPLRPVEVVEMLRPTIVQMLLPTRSLDVACSDAAATVLADRAQFEQVVVNLVANARDAMPAGGRVRITIDREDATDASWPLVRVTVSDQGTGIAPEQLPRIFEPFFTTKAAGRGTGLGLAMVASIIRRAGGTVEVTSEVGVGTAVTLRLPAVERRPTPIATMRALDLPDDVPGASRTLLLVDDDALVRRASARMLRRAGFTVLDFEDGASALEIAGDHRVHLDVLVTDLMMPGLSGRDVIERFRALRPHVPIVCVTGFASQREQDNPIALEVSAIVAKPFTSQVLLRAVDDAITAGAVAAG